MADTTSYGRPVSIPPQPDALDRMEFRAAVAEESGHITARVDVYDLLDLIRAYRELAGMPAGDGWQLAKIGWPTRAKLRVIAAINAISNDTCTIGGNL